MIHPPPPLAYARLYPHDTTEEIFRNDEYVEVVVDYGIEEMGSAPSGLSGPPEHYDPGSSTVFRICDITTAPDGSKITLTEQEIEKIDAWLQENHEFDDEPDWDY